MKSASHSLVSTLVLLSPGRLNPLLIAAWAVLIFWSAGVEAAVFDYSAPLQDVQASAAGSTVSYSVFDPVVGVKSDSTNSGPTSDLLKTNGVVTWSSGTSIYYRIYDPIRTNWMGGSTNFGTTQDLRSLHGVVTWSSGSTVVYRVYDPIRGLWQGGSALTGSTFDLSTTNGVVAWSSSSMIYYRAYDPAQGIWTGGATNSGSTFNLINLHGVLAWSSGSIIHSRTYDPTRAAWMGNSVATASGTFDLKNTNGVVAWSSGATIYYQVYDPARGLWMSGNTLSGNTANLSVVNSTVNWSTTSLSYTRGYDPASGNWYAGPTLPLAFFAVSTNAGNAPVFVYFMDMSIGAGGWNWNFGDGTSSTLRSPAHTFTGFLRYTVTQTAIGAGSHSTNRTIVGDITPPTGSIVINHGAALVTSNSVTLTLAATDNSGVVATMRLSNDGINWGAWEPYVTNKAWTLSAGDGSKQVYVQFRDVVDNSLNSYSDSINLDTTPVPTASFVTSNTNYNENAGLATIMVVLSAPFPRALSVDYSTSDGTALAGIDYTATSGTLVFGANITFQTFTVRILDDAFVERNETIGLTLGNPTNAIPGPAGTLTILDDDAPEIFFSSSTFSVDESGGGALINVNLSAESGRTVSINYATSNGTATAGSDFTSVGGTLVFNPGQTNRSFTVPIANDTLDETNETVRLYLSNPSNGVLGNPASATLTILDDDPPTVSFSSASASVNENAGNVSVNVVLSKPYSQTVNVDYSAAANSTAIAGSDYVLSGNTLTFLPGQTSKNIPITILNDTVAETNKTIQFILSGFFNASPGLTNSVLIIVDDDRPLLTSRRESASVFAITITGPPGQRLSIQSLTDLSTSWVNLLTLTNTTGTAQFSDLFSTKVTRRIYRAVVLQP